ncbi:hypothetical protein TTHERM_00852710 (macronuclear) [Tetrahymena thermophila SB210]|uniref:Uncharacterized protein n=1 Tax=Tetrahymena thermophila (strain SB210) TaxID=312017 RepID=Q24E69_TETTS|nr:hypothetical protein TTHERM_00852710 [Tetrahymena thermophila SB210]EAS06032.1 hypothetical protein TTHERM_00852710 [Tetrahymena thermophila SB210]|eukprot:XP_001026277.1 hypothetical protein TTHERM_00852710 [Tetrahymena thermophila SB210]
MSGNARDFFFNNRPLQNNLDYLKKTDSNSEVNWEGESEFRGNSAIHMQNSLHSKMSTFKQTTVKDDEAVYKTQIMKENNQSQSNQLRKVKSSTDNQIQNDNNSQEDQKKSNHDEKAQDNKFQQSPFADKSQQCDGSTNQATNHNEIDNPQEIREEFIAYQNQAIQNNQINLIIHQDLEQNVNSKHIANQQIDLKGDYSPACSQTSRIAKSPDSQQSPVDIKNDFENYRSPSEKNNQENLPPDTQKQKKKSVERPKIFKFKTDLECVYEVECWKDYNRENSRDNKKLGCSCSIF